jgi:hypothetical protein
MRRIQIATAAVIAATAAVATPAAAQGAHAGSYVTYAAAAPSAARDSVAAARAQQLAERGDQRFHAYDLTGARRDLQSAVEILRARKLYAGEALVRLATVTYTVDGAAKAAKVLVDAAEEAAAFGDIVVQVQSSFEASVLLRQAGDESQASRLLDATRRLLQSQYLPQDVKERIERRIIA